MEPEAGEGGKPTPETLMLKIKDEGKGVQSIKVVSVI